ncbi:alpha/beta fold hydrolase [Sandaracinus amylolyticus]|uniref:alpha/beta fold hydrolase n=1 Tax=Sandaracinus amylolyticus TaxID=927083 RepID=UPI001F3E543B|nr:alpha/beta fold hydrolase [Sandaracinus amylolyticus]UJR80214.1 Alpha/beta hydrolase [Sandaracinus amylolyticus]
MSGCGYLLRSPSRPVPALHYHWGSAEARASCLLVLLPGFFDDPDAFEREGVVDQVHRARPTCDVVAMSLHLYDYRDESVVDRVHEDVVLEARRRGYRQVWLVGISMGALAAVLTAREHPEDIDGLVLVSPYLGTPGFAARFERELARHGGLVAWARATPDRPCRISRVLHDPRPVWRWLAGYGSHPERMPPLWLAFGRDDRFAVAQRLLAGEVAPDHRIVVEGRHDWATWRRITQDVVAELPLELASDDVGAREVLPRGQLARTPAGNDW